MADSGKSALYVGSFSFDGKLKKDRMDEAVAEVAKGLNLKQACQVVYERHLLEGHSRPSASTIMQWTNWYGPYVTLMKRRKSEKKR